MCREKGGGEFGKALNEREERLGKSVSNLIYALTKKNTVKYSNFKK